MTQVVTSTLVRASGEPECGRASSAAPWIAMVLGALALGLLSGCTALLELDRDQCAVDGDCADLFPNSPYVCKEKVCERPSCDTDQSCRMRGEHFASSICVDNLCAGPECSAEIACGIGGVCNLGTNRCAPRECEITQDCLLKKPSPTVQCQQGFCVDPTWGCIGEPDNRVPVPGETGTLNVPLLSSADAKPVPGSSWRIKVCSPPQFDPNCNTPLAAQTSYDAQTGIATIAGLTYGVPIRIRFEESALFDEGGATTIIPMEFYTQKPAVGVTLTPPVRVVGRAGLAELILSFASAGVGSEQAVDPTKGNIYGLLFDCQDKPAPNVRLTYSDALSVPFVPQPVILYFDEQNIPKLTRQWSYGTGVFSSLNIPKGNINVATSLVLDPSADSNVIPTRLRDIRKEYAMSLPDVYMTTVHFYPRNYAAQ